jgi:hypothetical protein
MPAANRFSRPVLFAIKTSSTMFFNNHGGATEKSEAKSIHATPLSNGFIRLEISDQPEILPRYSKRPSRIQLLQARAEAADAPCDADSAEIRLSSSLQDDCHSRRSDARISIGPALEA